MMDQIPLLEIVDVDGRLTLICYQGEGLGTSRHCRVVQGFVRHYKEILLRMTRNTKWRLLTHSYELLVHILGQCPHYRHKIT